MSPIRTWRLSLQKTPKNRIFDKLASMSYNPIESPGQRFIHLTSLGGDFYFVSTKNMTQSILHLRYQKKGVDRLRRWLFLFPNSSSETLPHPALSLWERRYLRKRLRIRMECRFGKSISSPGF